MAEGLVKDFCPEKRRLHVEFMRAIQEVLSLCAQQTRALIDGNPELSRFDLLLHDASEKKITPNIH